MKPLIIIQIIFLTFSVTAFADPWPAPEIDRQDSTSGRLKHAVLIKFCPMALSDDFSFPTIQAGIEFKLSNRLSWYNEIGVKYRKSSFDPKDSNLIKSMGFKGKTEIRYYFRDKRKRVFEGLYLGANVFFTWDCHNTAVEYFRDSLILMKDAFGVQKTVIGFNLLIGYQRTLWKNLMIEMYAGPGLRYRILNTLHKEYNETRDKLIYSIDFTFASNRQLEDALSLVDPVTGNFTLGFRLCYKL